MNENIKSEGEIYTFSPRINPNSERIVQQNYRNQGIDLNNSKIREPYLKQNELYELHKYNQKKIEKITEDHYKSYNFNPQINKNDISESFSDRQETFKLKLNEKKLIIAEEITKTDIKTGQLLFTPRILKRNLSHVSI